MKDHPDQLELKESQVHPDQLELKELQGLPDLLVTQVFPVLQVILACKDLPDLLVTQVFPVLQVILACKDLPAQQAIKGIKALAGLTENRAHKELRGLKDLEVGRTRYHRILTYLLCLG
jgi:hypothetical protein